MISGRFREEVFNVMLALLLHERGVLSAPEKSYREALERHRGVPDVLVEYRGLRTAIEGKVDDHAGAGEEALRQAKERVEKGIAHIGVAVVYPDGLRGLTLEGLREALAQAKMQLAVCSEVEGETEQWLEGGVDALANLLRRTFELLAAEDVVSEVVKELDGGIESFARAAYTSKAATDKAAKILGIGKPPKQVEEPEDE